MVSLQPWARHSTSSIIFNYMILKSPILLLNVWLYGSTSYVWYMSSILVPLAHINSLLCSDTSLYYWTWEYVHYTLQQCTKWQQPTVLFYLWRKFTMIPWVQSLYWCKHSWRLSVLLHDFIHSIQHRSEYQLTQWINN